MMIILYTLLAVALVSLPTNSFSESAYKCGEGFVYVGDTKAKVFSKCGQPSFSSTDSISTRGDFAGSTIRIGRGTYWHGGSYSESSTPVESWAYNCGEGTLIHILVFENGKLKEIITGDRGTGPRRCN